MQNEFDAKKTQCGSNIKLRVFRFFLYIFFRHLQMASRLTDKKKKRNEVKLQLHESDIGLFDRDM